MEPVADVSSGVSSDHDPTRVDRERADTFERHVFVHYDAVWKYFMVRTRDTQLADDLTQDVFLAAFQALPRLRNSGAASVWLFQIAHNRLKQEWRGQALRRVISLDWLTSRIGQPPRELSQPDQSQSSADREDIHVVLVSLRSTDRDALLLHSVEGFTGREIAAILNISRFAAERRLSRAKHAFRARYDALSTANTER